VPEFIPEIPSAEVFFENADVVNDAFLPGDAWEDYVKPFSVAEDLYVHAAFAGWYSQVLSRAEAPMAWQEELLAYAAAMKTMALLPLMAPSTHLALEGVLTRLRQFMETPGPFWEDVDAVTREYWKRDKTVLAWATRTRNRRRETAWRKALAGPS
jgi:hypothetical protein